MAVQKERVSYRKCEPYIAIESAGWLTSWKCSLQLSLLSLYTWWRKKRKLYLCSDHYANVKQKQRSRVFILNDQAYRGVIIMCRVKEDIFQRCDTVTHSRAKLLPYFLFCFSTSIFPSEQNTYDNCDKNADVVELTHAYYSILLQCIKFGFTTLVSQMFSVRGWVKLVDSQSQSVFLVISCLTASLNKALLPAVVHSLRVFSNIWIIYIYITHLSFRKWTVLILKGSWAIRFSLGSLH